MNAAAAIIAGVIILAAASTAIAAAILGWIGLGESDVNGDPERDAGIADDVSLHRHWDHGSYRAATVPDLETARQLNRLRLQQAAAEYATIDTNLPRVETHG